MNKLPALLLLALSAISFTFAAEQKSPVAEKAKPDAKAAEKCDDGSCCDDDAKPADAKVAKDTKATDGKTNAAKKEGPKPVAKT